MLELYTKQKEREPEYDLLLDNTITLINIQYTGGNTFIHDRAFPIRKCLDLRSSNCSKMFNKSKQLPSCTENPSCVYKKCISE